MTKTDPPVQPVVNDGAQTVALQSLVNAVMRGLLATPGVARLVGRRLLIVYVVGRKSGRRYAIPVAYTRVPGGALLVGTPFGWVRNLRSGVPIEIRLRGRRLEADVQVVRAEADVVAHYARMCRANRQFAKFNRVGFDAAGNPDPADLHRAWATGARGVRLTPR